MVGKTNPLLVGFYPLPSGGSIGLASLRTPIGFFLLSCYIRLPFVIGNSGLDEFPIRGRQMGKDILK